MLILQQDETESGPRIRKTLVDKHGLDVQLVKTDISGTITSSGTIPDIDLYTYVRPSNGQRLWLIETRIFFPPDVELFRGYVVDGEPDDEQSRLIVSKNLQKGSML